MLADIRKAYIREADIGKADIRKADIRKADIRKEAWKQDTCRRSIILFTNRSLHPNSSRSSDGVSTITEVNVDLSLGQLRRTGVVDNVDHGAEDA